MKQLKFFALFLILILETVSLAEVPQVISYQGRLNDTGTGETVDGTHDITFNLYDSETELSSPLWTETHRDVPLTDGYFNVFLGSVNPFGSEVDFSGQYWLGVSIDGNPEMAPRFRLSASPYALNIPSMGALDKQVLAWNEDAGKWIPAFLESITEPCSTCESRGDSACVDWKYDGSDVIWTAWEDANEACTLAYFGIAKGHAGNTVTGERRTHINFGVSSLTGNADPDSFCTITGGLSNIDSASYGFIGGGQENVIEDASHHAVICGGEGNRTTHYYSFIGGGLGNMADSNYTVVCGGHYNKAEGHTAAVCAGYENYAAYGSFVGGGWQDTVRSRYSAICGGHSNLIEGYYSAISGGRINKSYNDYSTIGGGYSNIDSSDYSFIGGGYTNLISNNENYNVITGGSANFIDADYSVIGGGYIDTILFDYGFIGGGRRNRIIASSDGNTDYATIGGGDSNTVTAIYGGICAGYMNEAGNGSWNDTCAFVGGGWGNQAKTMFAAICGGRANSAEGWASTIAGGDSNVTDDCASAFIGGGRSNLIDGSGFSEYSVISGGYHNTITEDYSVIPGGASNNISDDYSFAFGREVTVTSDYVSAFYDTAYPGKLSVNNANPHSNFQVQGNVALACTTVSANFSLITNDYHTVIVDAGGVITITLPDASGCKGRIHYIRDIGGNNVTVDPTSGDIEGLGSKTLSANHGWIIQSDGDEWLIFSEYP